MPQISELRIQFAFIFIKFVFEYSKNTKYEKDMFNALFTALIKNFNIANVFKNLSFKSNPRNYRIYYNNFIKIINCNFINKENKNILKQLLSIIDRSIDKITKSKI